MEGIINEKRTRKGSLLIALSLLLAMMFGMSVHAEKYYFDFKLGDNYWASDGKVTLNYGDTIVSQSSFHIIVDGVGPTKVEISGDGIPEARWMYDGETQEFAWKVESTNNQTKVTLTRTRIEPEPAPEEPAPETDNNSNESTKTEEPEVEEPKETEEQIFTKELLTSVADAKAGDTKEVDATVWHSFSSDVLKELLSKEGVSYTFYYNYGGECFYITIPAGAVLEEGCEWYGPLKLNAMFGRTMIDKKDLHAAING